MASLYRTTSLSQWEDRLCLPGRLPAPSPSTGVSSARLRTQVGVLLGRPVVGPWGGTGPAPDLITGVPVFGEGRGVVPEDRGPERYHSVISQEGRCRDEYSGPEGTSDRRDGGIRSQRRKEMLQQGDTAKGLVPTPVVENFGQTLYSP